MSIAGNRMTDHELSNPLRGSSYCYFFTVRGVPCRKWGYRFCHRIHHPPHPIQQKLLCLKKENRPATCSTTLKVTPHKSIKMTYNPSLYWHRRSYSTHQKQIYIYIYIPLISDTTQNTETFLQTGYILLHSGLKICEIVILQTGNLQPRSYRDYSSSLCLPKGFWQCKFIISCHFQPPSLSVSTLCFHLFPHTVISSAVITDLKFLLHVMCLF